MKSISKEEVKVIHECIWASAYGPFFIDSNYKDNPFWEIHAIFGLTMEELGKIADALPNINPETEDSILAINNSLITYLAIRTSVRMRYGQNISLYLRKRF